MNGLIAGDRMTSGRSTLSVSRTSSLRMWNESQPLRSHLCHSLRLGLAYRCNGFTLLELLVVLVIVGLLASFVAPRYFDQVGKSEVKVVRAQLDAFEKALGAFRLDVGRFPTTEQGLLALIERPTNESKWAGPYLSRSVPNDPWGRPYVFRSPGDGGRDFDLLSLGKDGQRGGGGIDADIGL